MRNHKQILRLTFALTITIGLTLVISGCEDKTPPQIEQTKVEAVKNDKPRKNDNASDTKNRGPSLPSQSVSLLIHQLQDPKEQVWCKAQICLAFLGSEPLDELDELAKNANAEIKDRIRKLLAVSMMQSVRWEEVKKRKHLEAVVHEQISKGYELAKWLAARKILDISGGGGCAGGVREPSDLEKTLLSFRKLYGLGVPAALDMCTNKAPVARAYGILLLHSAAKATFVKRAVAKMVNDTGWMVTHGDCWVHGTSVAEYAKKFTSYSSSSNFLSKQIEHYVTTHCVIYCGGCCADCGLVYGVRTLYSDQVRKAAKNSQIIDTSWKTYNKLTWDQWWNTAQPVWNKWWQLHGKGKKPFNRWVFLNWMNMRLDGYTYNRKKNVDGTSLFRITGPKGARYDIFFNESKVVAMQGVLPFETDAIPKSLGKIIVHIPNGRSLELGPVVKTGYTTAIRVYRTPGELKSQ